MSVFPLPVRELEDWVPHRAPMMWIEQVTWADANEGECLVRLDRGGHFEGPSGIRATSMIEWIAQGYAFVRAAQVKAGLLTVIARPTRAFLVAISDAKFDYLVRPGALTGAKILRVRARNERDFGPLALVSGSVLNESGEVLATAKLKVYAE